MTGLRGVLVLTMKYIKRDSRNLFHFQDDAENDIMQENSGGIDAPSSANIEDLKKNLGGGGGKNNSVFAASLRELSQPNYYRYCAPTWIQYGVRDILIEPLLN